MAVIQTEKKSWPQRVPPLRSENEIKKQKQTVFVFSTKNSLQLMWALIEKQSLKIKQEGEQNGNP